MEFSGNLEGLAAALKTKKQLVDTDQPHEHIRPWLILGGGAFVGAYGGGVVTALAKTGFGNVFDGVFGVSTGAPANGYFLSAEPAGGQIHDHLYATTVYTVDARSDGFVKPRFRLDIPWLVDVFRGATGKPIVWDRVQAHSTRWLTVVTDWHTAKPLYLEPDNEDDFFGAIAGACSMPGYTDPVLYRDKLVTDSSCADPFPLQWLMAMDKEIRPTHVLLIANTWREPPSRRKRMLEKGLFETALRARTPIHIRRLFLERRDRFFADVATGLSRTDVTLAIDWLPWYVSSLERESAKLQALVHEGYNAWHHILTGERGW